MQGSNIIETINALVIETEVKLISSIILVLLIWLLRSLLIRLLFQRFKDVRSRSTTRQVINYAATVLGIVLIGRLWLEGFQSLLTLMALIAAALTVSLKELLLNIASWSVIIWRRLFNLGDYIELGTHRGEVVEMGHFYIILLESDPLQGPDLGSRNLIKIPNSLVLTQPIVNLSHGSRRLQTEIALFLSLDSNWQRARQILATAILRHSAQEDQPLLAADEPSKILQNIDPLKPQILVHIGEGKIILKGYFSSDSLKRQNIEQRIWTDLLENLQNQSDIKLM